MKFRSQFSANVPMEDVRLSEEHIWRYLSSKLLREMAIILVISLLPASALFAYRSMTPAPKFAAVATGEDVLWIDARSDADYAKGHIPGALSLNEKNWEQALPTLFENWQPPRPILVYCSAGCPASAKIAARLTELGIEPVSVMEGGFEEWKRSHEMQKLGANEQTFRQYD